MPDYVGRMMQEALKLPPSVILKNVELDEEGRYWLLSDGRLLSVCRQEPLYRHWCDDTEDNTGYRYVFIHNGKKKLYQHRLLAITFNIDKEKEKILQNCEVHHIDFDRTNNSLDNLCILTPEKHRAIHSIKRRLDKWEQEQELKE